MFEVSFILCSIYLLLGMALIAMCFNLMQVITVFFFFGLFFVSILILGPIEYNTIIYGCSKVALRHIRNEYD